MNDPYPKHPSDILVRVEENTGQGGKAYFQILNTFMENMEFPKDVAESVILQLMTLGKLRIDDEGGGSKRFELVREEDLLTEPQAKALFKDFVASQQKAAIPKNPEPQDNQAGKNKTISISIQRPR
ncbi:MAG: hypothetical protein QF406_10800 [Verrucomicrobiota bacterium]|nr:hypothetical protein [Verrucomicrobiota bacterium]